MSPVAVVHLVVLSAYAGFQWTVHLVVYPQLAEVPGPAFVAYERSHQRRVTHVVGPLFAAMTVTTTVLCLRPPTGLPLWGALASGALVITVLATTGLFAVPLHRRLEGGWDPAAHASLVRVDAIRVAASTANVVLVAFLVR